MKYVAPEMENTLVLAADVITTSPQTPVQPPKPGELPDDEF